MIATKIDPEELKRMDKIIRQRGLLNRSDLVRDAIRLYPSLSSLETETRLRILRLINESIGSSDETAAQLVEETRRERRDSNSEPGSVTFEDPGQSARKTGQKCERLLLIRHRRSSFKSTRFLLSVSDNFSINRLSDVTSLAPKASANPR